MRHPNQSYLAVLLGPNCLAGAAEIQGFPQEAEKRKNNEHSATTVLTRTFRVVETQQKSASTKSQSSSVPDLAFGVRGAVHLDTAVTWKAGKRREKWRKGENKGREKTTFSLLINPWEQEAAPRTNRWTRCDWRMEDDIERSNSTHQPENTRKYTRARICFLFILPQHGFVLVSVCVCVRVCSVTVV